MPQSVFYMSNIVYIEIPQLMAQHTVVQIGWIGRSHGLLYLWSCARFFAQRHRHWTSNFRTYWVSGSQDMAQKSPRLGTKLIEHSSSPSSWEKKGHEPSATPAVLDLLTGHQSTNEQGWAGRQKSFRYCWRRKRHLGKYETYVCMIVNAKRKRNFMNVLKIEVPMSIKQSISSLPKI